VKTLEETPLELCIPSAQAARAVVRPSVRGKFLWVGDEKLYLRGVTYGRSTWVLREVMRELLARYSAALSS